MINLDLHIDMTRVSERIYFPDIKFGYKTKAQHLCMCAYQRPI